MLEQTKSKVSGQMNASPVRNSPSVYQRFELETRETPPRRKQPRPFTPRVSRIGLASTLLRETLTLRFKLRRKEYRRTLLSRPCIYGVFGSRLGGFHPIKDKCTGCMRCVQEYPGICNVDRNPEFYEFADSYWIPDDPSTATPTTSPVSIISYEATTGKIPVRGMGYKGSFAGRGWDAVWTDMSEIVRPTRDGVYGREYISTLVDLGRKPEYLELSNRTATQLSRTVQSPIPIIFDYLPPNLTSESIIQSVALASEQAKTFFIAMPVQIQQLPQAYREQLIPLVSPQSVAENRDTISIARAVELSEYDANAIDQIRQLNPKSPISVRLPLTNNADQIAAELARKGMDVIHLLADYHGKSWNDDVFIKDLIRAVHIALVKEGLRDEVTLIASGGITLAEHVPKAIICGADLVAIDTTMLVALQARFLGECASSETGRINSETFDPRWGEQRLVNLLACWHDQLIEILSAMGIRDVRRLRGDVGRAMFNEDLEKEAFGEIERRT